MRRLWQFKWHLLALGTLFAMYGGCSGGCSGLSGCSSCPACASLGPIPGGFPAEQRIENAVQVRLTDSGIAFLESNLMPIANSLAGGALDFLPIARSTFSVPVIGSGTICAPGDCGASVTLRGVDLQPTPPNALVANINVGLTSQRGTAASHSRGPLPIEISIAGCDVDIDTSRGSRDYVTIRADVHFNNRTGAGDPRRGYTSVEVLEPGFAMGGEIENDDVDISGGFLGACNILDLGFIKSFVLDQLTGQIGGLIEGQINDALAQRCDRPEECPTGARCEGGDPSTEALDGTCMVGDQPVQSILGLENRGDFGGLLASISPGVHAPAQFVAAVGGPTLGTDPTVSGIEAVNNGLSVFLVGGFMSFDPSFTMTPGHNPCVPLRDPPALPTIPRNAQFRGNTTAAGAPTNVAIGVAEDYLNYSAYGVYDSGMLCVGVNSGLSQQLSSGLFSLLIQSLKSLVFPNAGAPIAIMLRPQQPPRIDVGVGGGPLLNVQMDELALDFYIFSEERYVRFMTVQTNLVIPVDLQVDAAGITPMVGDPTVTGTTISNSQLLTEDTAALGEVFESLLGMAFGLVAGMINPIAVPDLMGFQLNDLMLTGTREGSSDFLTIYSNLAFTPGMAISAPPETTLRVSSVHIDPRGLRPEAGWTRDLLPTARLEIDVEGGADGRDLEYSWRVDGGTWSRFSRERVVDIQPSAFVLQARHVIEARARIAGEPRSADPTPASSELLIDVLAPEISELEQVGDSVRVHAWDVLTETDDLEYRFRVEGGAWSAWSHQSTVELPYTDAQIEVEVRDEAGNVGVSRQGLIRGRPPANAGCSCTVAGAGAADGGKRGALALLGLLGLALVAFFRRRRREDAAARPFRLTKLARLALLGLLALPLATAGGGCSCGDDANPVPPGRDGGPDPRACGEPCGVGTLCCESSMMCQATPDPSTLCPPGLMCTGAPDFSITPGDGTSTCTITGTCTCAPPPPLDPGLLGTYLDIAVGSDSTVWVSGYAEGVPPRTYYGDLVLGRWNGTEVDWMPGILDGVPSGAAPTGDPTGWRGGVSMPGDDVGRWTSMALDASGSPLIAYYDKTNGALKLIRVVGGAATAPIVVDGAGDSGRYASLVLDSTGRPVIAYLRIDASPEAPGTFVASAMVAQASSATPAAGTDFTFSEIVRTPMPCRPDLCAEGQTCLEDGRCVTPDPDSACMATPCASSEACVAGACAAKLASNYVEEMPPGTGLYNSLVTDPTGGLALVFYDRANGNLMGARFDGSAWGTAFLIAGQNGMTDTSDAGIAASVSVDAGGVWHVSYVDGWEEALMYATVQGGTVTATTIVDRGVTDGTAMHSDGRHIVGDDSSIVVMPSGEVRIAYQDATAQRLMIATRAPGATDFAIRVLDGTDSAGYHVEQVLGGAQSYVAGWWRRQVEGDTPNGVRVFAMP